MRLAAQQQQQKIESPSQAARYINSLRQLEAYGLQKPPQKYIFEDIQGKNEAWKRSHACMEHLSQVWTSTHGFPDPQVSAFPQTWQRLSVLASGGEGEVYVLWVIPHRQLHFGPDILRTLHAHWALEKKR